jgi:hypothetical protein
VESVRQPKVLDTVVLVFTVIFSFAAFFVPDSPESVTKQTESDPGRDGFGTCGPDSVATG